MPRFLLVSVFSGLLTVASAAASDFPLEEYIPADYHRHYLSVIPNLSWTSSSTTNDIQVERQEQSYDSYHSRLHLNQGSEKFGQNLVWKASNGIGLDFRGFDGENGTRSPIEPLTINLHDSNRDDRTFEYNAFSRLSGKRYFLGDFFLSPSSGFNLTHSPLSGGKSQDWFIGLPGGAADSTRFTLTRGETEGSELYVAVDARVEAGYGRIQDVTFAETGLFLLDRISETLGRKITLDKAGMHELQAFMEARRKLRPFYDYRKAAIHDLESMVEFLSRQSGVEALPARAILEMSDEWYHSGRHRRESGWEVRAYPFLRWSWRETSTDRLRREYSHVLLPGSRVDTDDLIRLASGQPPTRFTRVEVRRFDGENSFGVGVRAAYHRPWRRFYQFELSGHSRFTRIAAEHGDEQQFDSLENSEGESTGWYYKVEYPYLESGWLASAAYYPNSRTTVRAALQGDWWLKMDYLGSKNGLVELFGESPVQKDISYRQNLGMYADYFLSHRLSLRLGADASFNWLYSQNEFRRADLNGGQQARVIENWNPQFGANARLTYYLF